MCSTHVPRVIMLDILRSLRVIAWIVVSPGHGRHFGVLSGHLQNFQFGGFVARLADNRRRNRTQFTIANKKIPSQLTENEKKERQNKEG